MCGYRFKVAFFDKCCDYSPHVTPVMDTTEKMLYVLVYCNTAQEVTSSKLGAIRAPLTAKVDIDDVFDGRRPCLLDYMLYAADAGADEVTRVAYPAKKGIVST